MVLALNATCAATGGCCFLLVPVLSAYVLANFAQVTTFVIRHHGLASREKIMKGGDIRLLQGREASAF